MYQVKHVAISIIIIIGACSFTLATGTSAHGDVSHGVVEHIKDSVENVNINNTTEISLPITEVNKPTEEAPTSPPDNSSTTTTSTVKPTTITTPTPVPTTNTTVTTISTSTTPVTTTKPTPNPNTSTTVIPTTTVKPTVAPTTPFPSHRRFDGPSFIGGIVLALGLVAIGFVAFKFYKARTELNYHTL